MRLIDADALITFWTECLTQEEIDTWDMRIATVIENVKDQPTVDAVTVVRCKDCAHYREAHKDGFGDCVFENWSKLALQNDYCSCGERSEVTE